MWVPIQNTSPQELAQRLVMLQQLKKSDAQIKQMPEWESNLPHLPVPLQEFYFHHSNYTERTENSRKIDKQSNKANNLKVILWLAY